MGTVRNVDVRPPRGFTGNPLAVERCPSAQLSDTQDLAARCPVNSQVGVIDFAAMNPNGPGAPRTSSYAPVYNMVPPKNAVAALGFQVQGRPFEILASLDPSDYSVVAKVQNANQSLPLFHQKLTLWGVPAPDQRPGSLGSSRRGRREAGALGLVASRFRS